MFLTRGFNHETHVSEKAFEYRQVYQNGLLIELRECLLGPGYVLWSRRES